MTTLPRTMSDMIDRVVELGSYGAIAQMALLAALRKTGPLYWGENMWYVRNDTLTRAPLREYRPDSGATSFDVRCAAEIPVPSL